MEGFKPTLHLLSFENLPIFDQLQIEEALFRVDERNWLIINFGTPPAIVVGISGKKEKLINRQVWTSRPIPLIRRFSGGGTVVVDENTLFVTFICRQDALNLSPYPQPIMEWSAKIYASLFPEGRFSLRENDYTLDGRLKWGGNAQSIMRGRWLHHSSLLWDFDPEKMNYLLMPERAPTYRLGRAHRDFLCCLKDHCSERSALQSKILEKLSEVFNLTAGSIAEAEALKGKPHRRATRFMMDLMD